MTQNKATKKHPHNPLWAGTFGCVMLAGIFYLDLISGDEFRVTILYQLVVVFFAWYLNIWYALIAAILCSVLRVFSVYMGGDSYSAIWIPAVNSLIRFATFSSTAWVIFYLKKSLSGQRILNQKLLLANEEISRLAQVKTDFTSMVSHELRTPLTVIREGVGMVQDGTMGALNPEQKKFLDLVKNNVDRLVRLIKDTLDFQKLSARQMQMHKQELSINDALREVAETFMVPIAGRGLEFFVDLDESLPKIYFDRDKIVQVLTNLVGNAINAMEKGAITLKTSRLENAIRVSVEDQGVGIKQEDQSKLFQAFSQLSAGNERKTGTTGLGLAISKQIIDMHQGRIGVESVYGKGATFFFLLPIQERRNRS